MSEDLEKRLLSLGEEIYLDKLRLADDYNCSDYREEGERAKESLRAAADALSALRKKLVAVEGERDKAEAQVVGAWNAFGPPGPKAPFAETARDVYEMFAMADGDIPEQIRCLEARATAAEAVLRALGFTDNILEEKIGWRGVYPKPSTDHHFRCEFCQQEHINCNEIPHTGDCPVVLARAALTKEPGE